MFLKNLNNIVTVIAISGILFTAYLYNQNSKLKSDNGRIVDNYKLLEQKNKQLSITYDEATASQQYKIKELSDSLEIKPKQIVKYVEIKVVDSIPYPVEAEVTKIDSNIYEFTKDTLCFSIEGRVKLLDSIPAVTITKLDYNNDINYVVYWERKQWKFLFIKSRLFGRKEAKLETFSTCGNATTTEVELIKK